MPPPLPPANLEPIKAEANRESIRQGDCTSLFLLIFSNLCHFLSQSWLEQARTCAAGALAFRPPGLLEMPHQSSRRLGWPWFPLSLKQLKPAVESGFKKTFTFSLEMLGSSIPCPFRSRLSRWLCLCVLGSGQPTGVWGVPRDIPVLFENGLASIS